MLTVVIQAGGKSLRMGQDKGLINYIGTPLVVSVIRRIAGLADEILVTTNNPDAYKFLGLPLFRDPIPGRGALGGLYTALSAANHPYVAVLACDMPFINSGMLAYQVSQLNASEADAAVPQTDAGYEPFHAVYRRDACINPLKSALDFGKWRVDSWFHEVKLLTIPLKKIKEFDPELLCFFNINTPDDLKYAEEIALRTED